MNLWTAHPDDPVAPRKPKVLIGVAGFDGVQAKAQENFFAFAYECGRRCPDYEFFLRILIKREQFRARNNLVDLAIANDCDYLLMLDDDMLVPPDLFLRMVKHNVPVVGCLYYQRGGAFHPVVLRMRRRSDGFRGVEFISHYDPIVRDRGLHRVDVIGGGCMLIKTDTFRKLSQPWFWVDGITGTDVHLCEQLHKAGVPVYCDTAIELGHVGEEQIITSRSIPPYGRKLGEANELLWNDLKEYFTLDEDQLSQAILSASEPLSQKKAWDQRPRETWEAVRDFYVKAGAEAVYLLAHYCLQYDEARAWTIAEQSQMIPPGSTILDYGAGLGYTALASAMHYGQHVIALDLPGPTMDFLRWRVQHHGLESKVEVVEFDTPVPPALHRTADAALVISVFDHLWDPYGTLAWLQQHVRQGGALVCDTWMSRPKTDHPQHICRFNPDTILREFKRHGFAEVPENPFLFTKET